jgi:hypothetical protein
MHSGLIIIPLLVIVVAGVVSIILYTLRLGISPMPSSSSARLSSLRLLGEWLASLPVHDRKNLTLVEAGSGWGGLAMMISQEFPELTVVGYERSPVPFLFSRIRSRLTGAPGPVFVRRNFSEGLEKGCDIVICYLYPGGMKRIAEMLELIREKPLVLITIAFHLPGHVPLRESLSRDMYRTPVYLYRTDQTRA